MERTKKLHDVQIKYSFPGTKFAGVDPKFHIFGVTNGFGVDVLDPKRKTVFSKLNRDALKKKIGFLNDWITNMVYKQ